jgi:DNA repair protein RecO (recombination protein O)
MESRRRKKPHPAKATHKIKVTKACLQLQMAFLKTRGIVIKEVGTGEADKIITLFTLNEGRISAFAKGGKRPRSKLSAASQLMCYGEYVLYSGKDLYIINSCEVIEPFYEIRNDVVKLTYAAHFLDIVLDIIQENQPLPALLKLLLNSLHILAKTERQPELVSRIFELRSLSSAGYAPHVNRCMNCGLEPVKFYSFSFLKCGFLCDREECSQKDRSSIIVSPGAAKALQHIVYSRMADLFRFGLSQEVLEELERITRRYLRERLERDFTKLDFLKKM